MTPQETQLVNDLFDRLAKLEAAPRDAAAERLIADGLQRAPHAVYALVQTALVQDEALKRANARIEELQAPSGGVPAAAQPAGFLETMREALTGRGPAHGSVPSVRPPAPGAQPPNLRSPNLQPQNFPPQDPQNLQPPSLQAHAGEPQPGYPPPSGYPGGAPLGAGGSFLGTAASAAAGMIGGALLLDGIRSMFGHRSGGFGPSTFAGFANQGSAPWGNNAAPAANGDLARDLGTDQISNQADNAGNDQPDDVDSAANPDDVDDADDNSEPDSDDFDDGGDTGDDSYDV